MVPAAAPEAAPARPRCRAFAGRLRPAEAGWLVAAVPVLVAIGLWNVLHGFEVAGAHRAYRASARGSDWPAAACSAPADAGPAAATWVVDRFKAQQRELRADRAGRVLIWYCTHGKACGGHADRLKGIASAFYLALLSRRALVVRWEQPDALEGYLAPASVAGDWRMAKFRSICPEVAADSAGFAERSGDGLLGDRRAAECRMDRLPHGTRVFDTLDDPEALVRFARGLRGDPDQFVVLKANQFSAALLARAAAALHARPDTRRRLGCLANPFKAALDLLFRPSVRLDAALQRHRDALGWAAGGGGAPVVGIHVRLGNRNQGFADPKRHALEDVAQFAECARYVERYYQLPAGTRWFLASDSPETAGAFAGLGLAAGKVFGALDALPAALREAMIVHTEKSKRSDAVRGQTYVFLEHLLLAEADYLVLSDSGYGATAAAWGGKTVQFHFRDCLPLVEPVAEVRHFRARARQQVAEEIETLN